MADAMPRVLLNLRFFARAGKPSTRTRRDSPLRAEGKTGTDLNILPSRRSTPSRCSSLRAARAIEFRGMVRGSPFLVLGR
jgi:hypothetical protein